MDIWNYEVFINGKKHADLLFLLNSNLSEKATEPP